MTRLLSALLAVCVAAPAWAATPERLGAELDVGDDPVATTVLPGDRVVAALVGETRSIAWRDAADYTEEPALLSSTIAPRALAAAGSDTEPVLVVAGSSLELLAFDTTSVPAVSSSKAVLALDGDEEGSLAAAVWSSDHDTVYAVDDVVPRLHSFDIADESAGTVVDLDFTPTGLSLLDSERLVVIGEDDDGPRMASIALDGTGGPGEVTDVDLTGLVDTSLEAVVGDGAGVGWLIATNEDYRLLVEFELGDTGRSNPRGCAIVDGVAGGFVFSTRNCELPASASSLAYAAGTDEDLEDVEHVYVGGGRSVSRVDVGESSTYELETPAITLTGTSGDVAASSAFDGYLYIAEPGTGLLAVVSPGPWVELDTPDTNLGGNADTLTFTITARLETLQSCSFTTHQDGDFTGTGTVLEDGSGVAPTDTPTEVSIPALDLEDGSGRLFVLCGDDDGVFGRASFPYYKGSLDAPEITALPGSEQVVVSFEGIDDDVDHYLIHFDTWNFGATGTAAGSNSTSTLSSPIEIDAGSGTVSTGDDDDATDDDDSADSEARDDSASSYTSTITDLVNDQVYYFAVSAVDEDGNEGPRSTIVEARPGITGGAAALAGDTYGCTCQNADAGATSPVGLAALIALLGLGRFRRRTYLRS